MGRGRGLVGCLMCRSLISDASEIRVGSVEAFLMG